MGQIQVHVYYFITLILESVKQLNMIKLSVYLYACPANLYPICVRPLCSLIGFSSYLMLTRLWVLSVIIMSGLRITWYSVVLLAYLIVSVLWQKSSTKQFHKTGSFIMSSGTPTDFFWYDYTVTILYLLYFSEEALNHSSNRFSIARSGHFRSKLIKSRSDNCVAIVSSSSRFLIISVLSRTRASVAQKPFVYVYCGWRW